jgi:hypothetical protein
MLTALACSHAFAQKEQPKIEGMNERIAEQQGWLDNYRRGKEIIHKLSSLSRDDTRKFDVTAYRGERVAFIGGGATNDLITNDGFYLRIVNPSNKDLRPHSVSFGAIICEKILQVLPENKIIVIEVIEKDWSVIGTT